MFLLDGSHSYKYYHPKYFLRICIPRQTIDFDLLLICYYFVVKLLLSYYLFVVDLLMNCC